MSLVKKVENQLNKVLKEALLKSFPLTEAELTNIKPPFLDEPKEKKFGDISTAITLKLASVLKQPPRDIAAKLIGAVKPLIGKHPLLEASIQGIDIAGVGFINFTFTPGYFYANLSEILESQGIGIAKTTKPKKVLLEFVSANPTGALSVAHGRQAAIGDCLCNVLEFLGHNVKREYYLNDEGRQIDILGNSIYLRLEELKGKNIEFPQDHYQGEYIVSLARELLEKTEDGNQKTETGEQKPEFFSEFGVKRILAVIKKELDDFGVRFDYFYSQASLRKSKKIDKTIAFLKKKGFVYEKEGAVWFASTKFSDDKDRVIIKSDGSYTYLAPDIAYHRDKLRRGFNCLVNLLGPDHHGYINRLKSAIDALGKDSGCLNILIVQLVTLFKEGKVVSMSTRRGEYITLRQVMDEVGKDAARFFFLMRKVSSHLDFDLELAKKQGSENPVYYVQYAHARISNILANIDDSRAALKDADLSLLKEEEELGLLRCVSRFEYTLGVIEGQLDPYSLTAYLQELAESFHKFYDSHRVLIDNKPLESARLSLISGCKIILALGLKLLGVSAPEKMYKA